MLSYSAWLKDLCWKTIVSPHACPAAPALAAAQNQKDGLEHNALVSWPGSAVISFIHPLESRLWNSNQRMGESLG